MVQPQSVKSWAANHVLALPEGASLELLLLLAQMRFTAPRIMDGALRVSRHSRIYGPVSATRKAGAPNLRQELGLPTATPTLFSIQCPLERGEPPFMGLPERTGIARACPDGLPIRDEGRVLSWAVAVARRLGGALRVAPSGTVLRPDIESSVDLTILSPVWLDPQAAHKVVSATLPHVGFHEGARTPEGVDLDPAQISEAYGLGADLGADGRIDVLIGLADDIPLALQPAWTGQTPISYQVRWTPLEMEELEMEDPPFDTKIARRRSFDLIARTAHRLHEAIGGHIVDDDWFLVDPQELP
ncbi:MAG TPA: hypothetical protein VK030_00860 [Actinomycetales bacterium]|nr:hypothetical protein [Actinomycetales bacterium]